jgi:hypothetical protein
MAVASAAATAVPVEVRVVVTVERASAVARAVPVLVWSSGGMSAAAVNRGPIGYMLPLKVRFGYRVIDGTNVPFLITVKSPTGSPVLGDDRSPFTMPAALNPPPCAA